MSRVLLVRPEESRSQYDFQGVIENECLELEWIMTILKEAGHDVTIFDKQVERKSFAAFLASQEFDVFYGECRCFQEPFLLEYAKLFRERCHGLVIAGGIHAQINPERLQKDFIDVILCSFNYYDLPAVIAGERDAANLVWQEEGVWHTTAKEAVDIRKMPRPDRTYFYAHPDRYPYLDMKHAMWVRSAFSCPYRCRFCLRNHMNNGVYSRRDVNDLVAEIAENDNETVYLVDDDFLFDENYVRQFIQAIREKGIRRKYICYGRADFTAAHEDLIREFQKIGLVYLLCGLEDISDSRLDSYDKRNTVAVNEQCIAVCQKYGVRLMAMFILGLDWRGRDFRQLYRYIVKHDLKHVAVSIYTPEIGISDAAYITDDLTHFDYLHLVAKPVHLSVRQWYFHYYVLLIRLFLKAQRDGVYDFLDYGSYIRSFLRTILHRSEEDA